MIGWVILAGLPLFFKLLMFSPIIYVVYMIMKFWIRHQQYGTIPKAMYLSSEHERILAKYFEYYQLLPEKSKKVFKKRVAYFMSAKTFVARDMIGVSWEMKVLISAAAIQLTFGFPRVHLSYFNYVLVYPGRYFSRATNTFNRGEVNPMAKSIVLGWEYFVEGYIKKEGRNLGLHEMAHALRLENRVMNHEYNFLDETVLQEWEVQAGQAMSEIANGSETFFREYGAANREEFFAVAVENFFERPQEFSEKHPRTYDVLCRLLKQNPKLLIK